MFNVSEKAIYCIPFFSNIILTKTIILIITIIDNSETFSHIKIIFYVYITQR